MKSSIHLFEEQTSQLLAHAETQLPQEAVALLFGTFSDDHTLVQHIELLPNDSTNNQTSFSVDPEIQYKLLMAADERGETMVGIFHTHPAPPRPSSSDIKNMKLNPVVWLVASKTTGEWIVRAYVLEKDTPVEIPIKIFTGSTD